MILIYTIMEWGILIFDEFSNKLHNESVIDNIIKLIDFLERKGIEGANKKKVMINEFLQKLMKKNLFTKDEFFSGKKNIKILLFYKLYWKGKIKKSEEEYSEKIIHLFNAIKNDIEGNITKSKLEEFLKMNHL